MGVKLVKRLLGLVLVVASLLGLALSVAGVAMVPRTATRVNQGVLGALDVTANALDVTAEGLNVALVAVGDASSALEAARATTLGVAQTVDDTRPMLRFMQDLAASDLPESIEATQTSLVAAEEAARVVDGTLDQLNAIALLTGLTYDPAVPLDEGVAGVADSLDGLPASFRAVAESLEAAEGNLSLTESQVADLAESLDAIEGSVSEAQTVVKQYQDLVDELGGQVDQVRAGVSNWVRMGTWVAYFVLTWLGLAQLAPLYVGARLLGVGPP